MITLKSSLFAFLFVFLLTSVSFGAQSVTSCRSFDAIDLGEEFVLTQDISTNSATCLEVNEIDISIDCQGYSISSAFYGIEINSESNINISNCNVNAPYGLSAIVDDSYFFNNTFTSTNYNELIDSNRNEFICNTFNGGNVGVDLTNSHNNTFTCLTILNTSLGINLTTSSNNTFEGEILNSTSVAIGLADNDLDIVDNKFEFKLYQNTLINDNLAEFEEHFDSNENDISKTYRTLFSTFNFFDAINSTLNLVNVELTTNESSFTLNETLNSSDEVAIFRSYFGYNLLGTNDFDEKLISNYEIRISKENYSTILENTSYKNEYNYTLYSTRGLDIMIVDLNSNQFDNETQTLIFTVSDLNNYSIDEVNVTLNGADVNYSLTGLNYELELNGSNLTLGTQNISISAKNEFDVITVKNLTFNIISSDAPKINANLSKSEVFTNENITLNVNITSTSNFTYAITTSLFETLGNVTSQNYSSNQSGNITFTIVATDSNGLVSSLNISLFVYQNETILFNLDGTTPISSNGNGKLEIYSINESNNQTMWYEFYINSTLIQNSSTLIFEFNPNTYSSNFYTVFDNTSNSTKTYLDVNVFVKTPIGTFGNQTFIFEIVNESNVSASVTLPSSIKTTQSANVVISYSSSLNYSFSEVEVKLGNESLGNFTSQSFSLSGFSKGTHTLVFTICNEYFECVDITKTLTVTSSSSGGGGGGSSSSSSTKRTTPLGLGNTNAEFRLVEQNSVQEEPIQVVSTPFFEEVVDDQLEIYEVESGSLDVDESNVLQGQSGQLTQGVGSWFAIIIGFIVISAIVYFALIRRS